MSDWKSRATPAKPAAWEGEPATAADWDAQPGVPKTPAEPEGQSAPETAMHSGLQGLSFGLADEAQGLVGGAATAGKIGLEKLGLSEEPEALADPLGGDNRQGALERILAGYRQGRDWERDAVRQGEHDNPKTALLTQILGSLAAPGPKGTPLAKGATRLERMASMGKSAAPIGAAFGAGNSEADLSKGEVGGFLKDTATGGALSVGTGAVLGGVLHGPLSSLEGKERAAIDKAQAMATEALDKPQRQAQGALGGRVQAAHRNLEAAGEAVTDPKVDRGVSDELAKFLDSPEGVALRNRVMKSKAEALPGNLSEVDAAQAAFDAAKGANTPQAVEKEAARILGPERFKEATMMRLKKYAGRTLPPLIGSGVGSYLGGPEGAIGGALLGGMASSIMGSPGTALANYMKDPAVMLRLAQTGQAAPMLPQKALASLTSEEDKKRRLEEMFASLLGQSPE